MPVDLAPSELTECTKSASATEMSEISPLSHIGFDEKSTLKNNGHVFIQQQIGDEDFALIIKLK